MSEFMNEWTTQHHLAVSFFQSNGRWPTGDDDFPGTDNIGEWCDHVRSEYKERRLSSLQLRLLLDSHFSFMTPMEKWTYQFTQIQEFKKEHGRLPIFNEQYPEGNFLGRWYKIQERAISKDELSDAQKDAINSL